MFHYNTSAKILPFYFTLLSEPRSLIYRNVFNHWVDSYRTLHNWRRGNGAINCFISTVWKILQIWTFHIETQNNKFLSGISKKKKKNKLSLLLKCVEYTLEVWPFKRRHKGLCVKCQTHRTISVCLFVIVCFHVSSSWYYEYGFVVPFCLCINANQYASSKSSVIFVTLNDCEWLCLDTLPVTSFFFFLTVPNSYAHHFQVSTIFTLAAVSILMYKYYSQSTMFMTKP